MTNNICDYLQRKVKDFLAQKNESVRWLCRLTGTSYSTLYRLQSGELSKLGFNSAYKILKVIEPENFLSILGDYYPEETRDLGPQSEVKTDEKLELAERIADDFFMYRVYAFASSVRLSNPECIKERFGSEGLQILEELIKMGALEESEGQLVDRLDGIVYPSERTVKRVCDYHFEMVSLGSAGSHIQNYRTALSSVGVAEWHRAATEFRNKLVQIAEAHPGETVAVAAAIVGPAMNKGK